MGNDTRSGATSPSTPTKNVLGEEATALIQEGLKNTGLVRESFTEALADNIALMTLMRVGREENGERGDVAAVEEATEVEAGVKVSEEEEEEEAKLYLLVSAY